MVHRSSPSALVVRFPGFGTQRAIQRALDAGTIVLAAAGNEVGFVVFPAAFDEVIAVAASNIRDEPWSGSSHGPAVDITAPGESVWRARTARESQRPTAFHGRARQRDVVCGRDDGWRRRAVGLVSRLDKARAALWRRQHARVFKQTAAGHLPDAARLGHVRVRPWHRRREGGCWQSRCPPPRRRASCANARSGRDCRRTRPASRCWCISCPACSRTRVEEVVADLLHITDRDLPSVLQDDGDELAFQLVMQPTLLANVRDGNAAADAQRDPRVRIAAPLLAGGHLAQLQKRLAIIECATHGTSLYWTLFGITQTMSPTMASRRRSGAAPDDRHNQIAVALSRPGPEGARALERSASRGSAARRSILILHRRPDDRASKVDDGASRRSRRPEDRSSPHRCCAIPRAACAGADRRDRRCASSPASAAAHARERSRPSTV